ncbi:cytochrome p450 [Fusarium flagelliforme]|uniref:Cytochrome p450 n=1 Tax=Fusarium flagelliforme TaxID=2675880 RepID=A0A395MY09_9HYPO|nr:cytochrome p450 [Fusarium flagelliforme]
MNILLTALIVALLIWITSHIRTLIRNYRAACATGLPIVICPYDPDSFVFAVVSEPLRPILKAVFPATTITAFEVTCWGWEFHDKGAVHERLGQAFMVVTTGHNRLVCANPSMAHSILARRKDFLHPDISLKTMGLLGPNLVTSKDESWSRQRRIIAPAFNERISLAVWKEGVQQASSLIEHMMSCVSAPQSTTSTVSSTADTSSDSLPGLRAIAINVLTRVAYGRHTPFSISSSYRDPNMSLSYVDGIALVTDLLLAAAFVPSSVLRLPFMPRLSRRLGQALVQLPNLTTDMLDQERLRLSDDVQNNIMTTLLRLSDQAKVDDRNYGIIFTRTEKKHYLTENEIAGNLFILTAAGFDTTSNTMSYALVLLAAYPQWQAWIRAEIDVVLRDHDGRLAQEEYATIFPKLTRCLAIMFETLRLYPAVMVQLQAEFNLIADGFLGGRSYWRTWYQLGIHTNMAFLLRSQSIMTPVLTPGLPSPATLLFFSLPSTSSNPSKPPWTEHAFADIVYGFVIDKAQRENRGQSNLSMQHPEYLCIDLFATASSMVALPGEMKNGYEWRKPLDWAAWLATIASLVIAAGAARLTINQIFEDAATKRNAQSCSLAWSTVGDTTTFQGFAYHASGTRLDYMVDRKEKQDIATRKYFKTL